MKKVKVEEVKSGNAVMQTFGGLLIAVGILDFALSWEPAATAATTTTAGRPSSS